MLSDAIGNRIKEERIKKGWTQNELGSKIGCSGVAIMRYEKDFNDKDHREPSLDKIESMAEAFGITPFELLGFSYFDMKYPNIGKEVQEYEAFEKYLISLGYSIKISPESPDGEELSVTISKGKGTKAVTLTAKEMNLFQSEIKKAVEFALFQRKEK